MKQRFSTYDVICMAAELQSLVGLRVNQIYDIDNKTYLIKFQDKDVKVTLLMESGIRFHTTSFEWPKNPSPSGFTMKLRKHLKNKRLESLRQLGTDRILDFQFGIDDAAYHLILELYDRGNIILCDYEMTILNVLRPHTEGETIRFVVREKYPEARARVNEETNAERIRDILHNVKKDDSLKQVLMPALDCGPTVLTHVLLKYGLSDYKVKCKNQTEEHVEPVSKDGETSGAIGDKNKKGKKAKEKKPKINENNSIRWFDEEKDFNVLVQALDEARTIMKNVVKNDDSPRGFIIQKSEKKPAATEGAEPEELYFNIEYHPMLFEQFRDFKFIEFAKFDLAVDEFYSTMVGQKIDLKTYQQECEALKKLSNVKKDHEKRLDELSKAQELNKHRAELITRNQELINSILFTMRSLIANQMSWDAINDFVKTAQATGDAVANSIKQLKLDTNHVSVFLTDPYASLDSDSSFDLEGSENEDKSDNNKSHSMVVDIDLGLSAYANATRYYDQKRSAAQKEHRTIESSTKALKNAERKTQQHLKEVRMISNITKARKIFWFEKFYWFISSENYLVIGGRDQQQNELIVKRYLRTNDIYVHADIQGASSIVIRNPFAGSSSDPQATPPPKTLLEAGAMAISYSVAWDAKITTSAYWVRADQVSKTAPTGEYLETGSFMIRGKKNFLPPCHLILGLSIMFKLEESSISRHAGERCVRKFDEKPDKKVESDDESNVSEKPVENIIEEDVASNHSNDANDSSESDDDPSVVKYPDTHIKTGNFSTQLNFEPNTERQLSHHGIEQDDGEQESAIIHAAPQQAPRKNRIIHKEKQGAKKKQQQKQHKENEQQVKSQQFQQNENKSGPKPMSKHQKKKLKIIKSKYKDQDEEERQMRLEILQSAGKKKIETKKKEETDDFDQKPKMSEEKKKPSVEKKTIETAPGDVEALEMDDENVGDSNDVDMLNTLTGCPCTEDELLFALPVVAPYNALQNYKFKVKITPGTARRGKTSKLALMMFLKEKTCSNQEKDLIKAIKHDTAARNMPGKVKMSAPQLQRLKN